MPRKKTNEEFLKKLEEKGRFDIKPLEEYKGAHEKILFECLRNENHPNWYADPANILSGSKCPHCREHPHISRYDFEQKLKDQNIPMKIIGEFNGVSKPVVLQCDKGHIWHLNEASYAYYDGRTGCPFCNKEKNIISNKFPELVCYFKDKEMANKLTSGQVGIKVDCICPDCGQEFTIELQELIYKKNKCPHCTGDSLSRPNRLLWELLNYLENQCELIDREYHDDWCNPYCYDGYFLKNSLNFLVEMHGLQHYTNANKQKLKEQQERDAIKENLAKQNNFKLIVVECKRTDWNYMINNIKKTELAKIFDLDNVDWVEIKKRCMTKLTKQIITLYKNGATVGQIVKSLGVNENTVRKHLQREAAEGNVQYTKTDIKVYTKRKARITNIETRFIKEFDSLQELYKYTSDDGIKFTKSRIYKCLKGYKIQRGTKSRQPVSNIYRGYKIEYADNKDLTTNADYPHGIPAQ